MVIWFRAEQFPPLVSVPPIVTTGPSGSSQAAVPTLQVRPSCISHILPNTRT